MTKVFCAGIAFVSCSTLTTVSERCDIGASDLRKLSIEAFLSHGVTPDYDLRQGYRLGSYLC